MSTPRAPLCLSSVAVPLLAGLGALASLPAQAEVFFRPYGGVYVERFYEPPPPPVYYPPPPAYGAPPRFPYADIGPMLRSMGMSGIGRARVDGPTYLVDATARSGTRMRVRIDAYTGQVIAMHPIGGAPAGPPSAGQASRVPAMRQASPVVPPLPPARPPELAAVPAPAPSMPAPPADAPPANAPAPGTAASPAASSDAATATPATPGAVRVIPGTAVPPSAAPRTDAAGRESGSGGAAKATTPEAAAAETSPAEAPPQSSGTGTGTGTGSDTPAGTASVFARGTSTRSAPAENPGDE